MVRQQAMEDRIRIGRVMVSLEIPYPLDPEAASAVEAAKHQYVTTGEMLEEGGEPGQWLLESFLAEGRTALPDNAYKLRKAGESISEETKESFSDQEACGRFVSGQDYSYGLADVPGSDYEARSESLLQAIKNLGIESYVIELPTLPHAFLREAPLVVREWIDRYLLELCEWGARIAEKGYLVEEPTDSHPFVWYRITDPDGSQANREVLGNLWQLTKNHVSGLPVAEKEIDGRPYVRFSDYLKWRGCKAKGNLKADLQQGLVVGRWNQ